MRGNNDNNNKDRHPYLSGNYAPVEKVLPLTPCSYEGLIPEDLVGGQYIRNGANPLVNQNLGRDAHWFDGDGMLSGVLFKAVKGGGIEPHFVNQFLITDVYDYSKHSVLLLKKPVLPSITTLIGPAKAVLSVFLSVFRSILLVILSHFGGSPAIRRISVANTNVIYHDGRALATCESGPPLRFLLPSLETVGWFNGRYSQNEQVTDERSGFGGTGPLAFLREWMTAHPRVDPVTGELIAFHSTFVKPFVRYSIVRPEKQIDPGSSTFDEEVPGITSAKMMHDFGVSSRHTVIMDLPLSLDPRNLAHGLPGLHYNPAKRSRFGVFPRYAPYEIKWFETNPCLIFHTANCWDTVSPLAKKECPEEEETVVNLLACRLTSSAIIFGPGNISAPMSDTAPPEYTEEEQCRLYYYSFPLTPRGSNQPNHIRHQWALSSIPFELPTVPVTKSMSECRYVYGCSAPSFTTAPGKAAKIDHLAKMDTRTLIAQGVSNPPVSIKGCVDNRTVPQIMSSSDPNDPIQLFQMPPGWYAQEPRFVPRSNPTSEDDGWLLVYVFDESSQLDEDGSCREDARSELWIIDARRMRDVVARIKLPQRVPYGLHGNWFSREDIQNQRPHGAVRKITAGSLSVGQGGIVSGIGALVERWLS